MFWCWRCDAPLPRDLDDGRPLGCGLCLACCREHHRHAHAPARRP